MRVIGSAFSAPRIHVVTALLGAWVWFAGGESVWAAEAASAGSQPAVQAPSELDGIRRVACADHLQTIGLAIFEYAQAHEDITPPDLGTLVTAQHLELPTFVCPAAGGAVPLRWKELNPQAQADWVNAHTDYVYLAASKNINHLIGQQAVIAYERDDDHGGAGMNVLLGDSRVAFVALDAAHQALGKEAGTERKTTRVPLTPGQTVRLADLTLDQARTLLARMQIAELRGALDAFEIDNGRFPTAAEGLDALAHKPAGNADGWKHPYIQAVPLDPWGRPFVYTSPGPNREDFELKSAGPDGKPGTADDVSSK